MRTSPLLPGEVGELRRIRPKANPAAAALTFAAGFLFGLASYGAAALVRLLRS